QNTYSISPAQGGRETTTSAHPLAPPTPAASARWGAAKKLCAASRQPPERGTQACCRDTKIGSNSALTATQQLRRALHQQGTSMHQVHQPDPYQASFLRRRRCMPLNDC